MSAVGDLIDRFAAGSALLSYATSGLPRELEQARPGPGAWSIAELVVHLLETDLVYGERMKRVIAEERPPLLAFDENAWVERLGAQEMSVEAAVNLFAAHRQWMTTILRRRDEADFARVGMHSERGPMSLAELLVIISNHVDHHLKFLYAKRANMGVSLYPRYTREPE